MLAALLRRLLLLQIAIGTSVALGLWYFKLIALWAAVLIPLAWPFAFMVFLEIWTCSVSRANESALAWWKSLAGEIRSGILTFILRQPWSFAPPEMLPALSKPERIPVVLVHGYMCNHRIWDDLVTLLRQQGHAVYAIDLEPLFCSIDNYAQWIEHAVEKLLSSTGHKQVALVGHSMGGIAIRAWMRAHGTQRAARVITLGSPHAGVKTDMPGLPTNARQMQWQSDWLKALAVSEAHDVRKVLQIAITPQDNVVYPQRVQTVHGIEPIVFSGIGHVQLCNDPKVLQWVTDQLRDFAAS